MIEYFNLTNFGRIKQPKRESLLEVISLKNDVEERVRDVEKLLGFKSIPFKEKDFSENLSQVESQFLSASKVRKHNLDEVRESDAEGSIAIENKEGAAMKKKGSAGKSNFHKNEQSQSKFDAAILPLTPPYYDNASVVIPELPSGKTLKFYIYSTWGDAFYLGLNGIELYDQNGEQIIIENVKEQVKAKPSDINSLPEYGQDPRTVDKLFDGHYLTCDDLHVWLAPFTRGKEHTIEIDFKSTKTLSMIRVWNYNKSRIHSYRGVKDIAIKCDDKFIFKGEIQKAPGNLKGAESSCEYLMFT